MGVRLVRCAAAFVLVVGVTGISFVSAAPAFAAMPVRDGHRCTIVGTRVTTSRPRAVVCGTGRNDVLVGNGQNDVLIGGPGNDVLTCGRDKHCLLIGGGGNDRLIGQGGPVAASFADHVTSLVASLATHLETDKAIHQTDHLTGITNLIGGHGPMS